MIVQLRKNIFLGDENAYTTLQELKDKGITTVLVVSNEMSLMPEDASGVSVYKMGLIDGPNYGYVKDLACHIPKYLTQNGQTILIQSKTGLRRGAFVAARAICELENKSIYEVFLQIQEMIPAIDLTKVYF